MGVYDCQGEYCGPGQCTGHTCFIATVAYGTSFAKEIDSFRGFRNKVLMTNKLGRIFVKFYYSESRKLCNILVDMETTKRVLRVLLNPLAKILKGFDKYYTASKKDITIGKHIDRVINLLK